MEKRYLNNIVKNFIFTTQNRSHSKIIKQIYLYLNIKYYTIFYWDLNILQKSLHILLIGLTLYKKYCGDFIIDL